MSLKILSICPGGLGFNVPITTQQLPRCFLAYLNLYILKKSTWPIRWYGPLMRPRWASRLVNYLLKSSAALHLVTLDRGLLLLYLVCFFPVFIGAVNLTCICASILDVRITCKSWSLGIRGCRVINHSKCLKSSDYFPCVLEHNSLPWQRPNYSVKKPVRINQWKTRDHPLCATWNVPRTPHTRSSVYPTTKRVGLESMVQVIE